MSMYIDLRINRDVVETIKVTNIGHPSTGRAESDDDLREYRWSYDYVAISGIVRHRRGEGASKLAEIVLAAVNSVDHATK